MLAGAADGRLALFNLADGTARTLLAPSEAKLSHAGLSDDGRTAMVVVDQRVATFIPLDGGEIARVTCRAPIDAALPLGDGAATLVLDRRHVGELRPSPEGAAISSWGDVLGPFDRCDALGRPSGAGGAAVHLRLDRGRPHRRAAPAPRHDRGRHARQ